VTDQGPARPEPWIETPQGMLFFANALLVAFNLLPAFPMDGGRALRAVLSFGLSRRRATVIAARIGQGMALLFGLLALFAFQPFLLLIAAFVWFGAAHEAQHARMRDALDGVTVADVMRRDFRTLAPAADVGRAVDLTFAGSQRDFPVVEEGRVLGLLGRRDLVDAVSRRRTADPVDRVMRRGFATAEATELVDRALARLRDAGLEAVPVLDASGRLVGLFTLDNVGEFIRLRDAATADTDGRRN